jgi:putative aldouronate transport system permease protein
MAVELTTRPVRVTRRFRARQSLQRHWQLHLLTVVPLLFFVVFKYVPMANAVIAFKDYSVVLGPWGSAWVGWDNFARMFGNPVFGSLVTNTLQLSGYYLLAGFPVPLILALCLNEIRSRFFRRTVQMVTYAPYFISTVVVVSMMMLFFAPRIGIASRVLEPLGLGGLDVMGSEAVFRHLYVWSDIWQTAGYSAVIYMAALAGIDPALYDAAKVDGASRMQRIRHVDIPAILPTCAVVLILGVGNLMAVGFEKAFLLQNPLNFGSSEIISTYVYKTGLLNADFGLATAVGLFNAVVNLALLVVVNTIIKRIGGSSLW